MHYYPHYIADYDAATKHLSWLEDASYVRMLRLYYDTERPLPLDRGALYRLVRARAKSERQAVDTVLAEFFEQREDGWHHARCDAEIAAFRARVERSREAGRRGGRPRSTPPDEGTAGQSEETRGASSGFPKKNLQVSRGFSAGNPDHNPEESPLRTQNSEPRTQNKNPAPVLCLSGSSTFGKGRKALRVPASSEKSAAAPAANGHDPGSPRAPKTAATWAAYASAYTERWHVEPVRNRKTNALLAQLVDRVGAAEAPQVAAWYVASNAALYVRSKHCADLLVRDCEGLRTEWATQTRMTDTEARQADEHQAAYEAVRWVRAHLAATTEEAADGPLH